MFHSIKMLFLHLRKDKILMLHIKISCEMVNCYKITDYVFAYSVNTSVLHELTFEISFFNFKSWALEYKECFIKAGLSDTNI